MHNFKKVICMAVSATMLVGSIAACSKSDKGGDDADLEDVVATYLDNVINSKVGKNAKIVEDGEDAVGEMDLDATSEAIIALIENLDPTSDDYQDKRKEILDTMIKDVTMRNKTKLIDSFIRKEVDEDQLGFMRGKADGTIDLETRLNNFVAEERNKAIAELAEQEDIPMDALKKFMDEYEYLHREKSEIIRDAVKDKKMLYKERRSLMSRVLARLHAIVSVFFWE